MRNFSILITYFVHIIFCSHFRGGIISWRPLNNNHSNDSFIQIQIHQRYSWRREIYPCNDSTIANNGLLTSGSALRCYTGSCIKAKWINLTTNVFCTDFSINGDLSSGERYDIITLPVNISISVGFVSSAWLSNLAIGANGYWYLINRINTIRRPDGYINTSPVSTTLPVIYKVAHTQHVHVIQMSDDDSGDIIKCRWSNNTSSSNINLYNECGSVCLGVPGAILINNNCTIIFTLNLVSIFYAVALQIEDYYSSTSTIPMSSVPIQFLFYSYANSGGCNTPPSIIGNRPNRACIGIPVGSNVTEYVLAQVYCPNKTIIDFVTSSPIGMSKSIITNPSSNIYQIVLKWIPTANQYGPQGFCAGAVDNTNIQSEQWCITFLVGFDSPNLIRTLIIQGTASPIGTIFANQTTFSIQASRPVSRPNRNYTYVYFNDASTNTTVYKMDCGWNSHVFYNGYTIVFYIPISPWILGHSYYVTFDSGVASGTDFCGPESSPITDRTFWTFDIWNPSALSTIPTSTSTTPLATQTVTTKPLGTSTPNTLMTTTGIAISSTTTLTTTTSSSSISTSVTTIITQIIELEINIINPKNMIETCQQPIIIMTIAIYIVFFCIHILAMNIAFLKFSDMFNPNKIQVQIRHQTRINKIFVT